jgi:anaerobic selenocysteine-containing dehydrogenase
MIATVENGRITRLEGNPEHGYTRGYLCKKGYQYPNRVYSPNRVLYPQKKVNGKWQRITWDEALDTIAENILFFQKSYGDSSIMHYQRSSSWGATKHLVKRFFNLLGDVTTQSGSLCSGSVMAAQKADFGSRLGNDPEDFVNSKTIVIWGKDPFKSTIHVIPILKEARKRGAHIIVIDPIRTETASFADEHIAPRPGSDGYMAIGMAQYLLDMGLADTGFIEAHTIGYDAYLSLIRSFSMAQIAQACDLDVQVIENLARRYGERKPSSILLGYGINKWVHSPEMIRLIDALGALTGNIGIQGGGVNHGFQTKRHFDPGVIAPRVAGQKREIPEPLLGRGLLESENPSIKMIWINGTNPVASCPDSNSVMKALKRLDFVVLVDHFMTDTADFAHIFLPTTTFLEEEDIVVSWGHNWIGPVNQAIEPLGETRSDLQIVMDLSKRLGLHDKMAGTTRTWLKRLLLPMEKAGLSVERVMKSPVRCPIAPMVAFQDRKFLTASGKFEWIDRFYEKPENPHPFHLLTILSKDWLNSLVLEEEHPEIPKILMHPVSAKEMHIEEKSRAVLKSAAGELIVEAHLSETVRRDVIALPHGTWIKKGGGVNQLTEGLISSSGKMAAYYSSKVSIESLNP